MADVTNAKDRRALENKKNKQCGAQEGLLIFFFGDNTFAWMTASKLKPFEANREVLSAPKEPVTEAWHAALRCANQCAAQSRKDMTDSGTSSKKQTDQTTVHNMANLANDGLFSKIWGQQSESQRTTTEDEAARLRQLIAEQEQHQRDEAMQRSRAEAQEERRLRQLVAEQEQRQRDEAMQRSRAEAQEERERRKKVQEQEMRAKQLAAAAAAEEQDRMEKALQQQEMRAKQSAAPAPAPVPTPAAAAAPVVSAPPGTHAEPAPSLYTRYYKPGTEPIEID